MNDIEKLAVEKKKAWWWTLLEAFVPAAAVWSAMCAVLEEYTRVERHSGHAIVPLVISAIFVWAAFYFLIVRLRTGSSR
jgi:glucan phosphoethanolaminetransferase (alkaline phosphatase superfamily)